MTNKVLFIRKFLEQGYKDNDLKKVIGSENNTHFFNLLIDYIIDEMNYITNNNSHNITIYNNIMLSIENVITLIREDSQIEKRVAIRKIQKLINFTKKHKGLINNSDVIDFYNNLLELGSMFYNEFDSKESLYKEDQDYLFLNTLIYQVKNYDLIKYLLIKFPKLLKVKTPDGNNIVEDILDKYIMYLKEENQDDYYNILYYDSIIDLFLKNNKDKIDSRIKNKILLIIDELKREKRGKKKYEKKLYLLACLRDKLTSDNAFIIKDIKELNYKYNINLIDINDNDNFFQINKSFSDYIDYKNNYVISIDPEDVNYIDDALSLRKLKNNNYLLGVYISDVSSITKPNSDIDIEAYKRGRTIFFSNNTELSMIPSQFACKTCSLSPKGVKRSICCMVEIDNYGNIINYRFFKATITNKQKLSYSAADRIIKGTENETKLYKTLKDLETLSNILRKKNNSNNHYRALEEEKNIETDYNDIIKNSTSNQIVSEFMILVNHLAAKHAFELKIPYIYRIHEQYNIEKATSVIEGFSDFIKKGVSKKVLREILLTSFSKARYSVDNKGHIGLGYDAYSHSTSPIRRYVDLINQRIIVNFFINNNYKDKDIYFWEDNLPTIANLQNLKEEITNNYINEYHQIKYKEKKRSK